MSTRSRRPRASLAQAVAALSLALAAATPMQAAEETAKTPDAVKSEAGKADATQAVPVAGDSKGTNAKAANPCAAGKKKKKKKGPCSVGG